MDFLRSSLLVTMTPGPSKRAADAQPSIPRPPKKSKPTFRLAKDPGMEQICATTIKRHSHGRLGYQKMGSVRSAEEPAVANKVPDATEIEANVEGDFPAGELEHDYGIEDAPTNVTSKKKINTTSVSETLILHLLTVL